MYSGLYVKLASLHTKEAIRLQNGKFKSIMNILVLRITKETEILLMTEDEQVTIMGLRSLIRTKFGE